MKTVLISVDGMRPDALAAVPKAQKMLAKSAYSLRAQTVDPSVTLPCHMSMFHSVEPARHGITTNIYVPQVRPVNGLCEVLRRQHKLNAFFYNWEELRDLTRPDSLTHSSYWSGHTRDYETANERVTDDAIAFIQAEQPDFVFLYLGWVDAAGHGHGWMSEEYMRAISGSWDCIDRLWESLPEDYAVIVTADHGGHGRYHGTLEPEDMTIPMILAGTSLPCGEMKQDVSILDVAPTVTSLLGVEPDEEWEGKSLL